MICAECKGTGWEETTGIGGTVCRVCGGSGQEEEDETLVV